MTHVPRIALVTGANHGIGAAVATGLAAAGVDVLVTYLRHTNAATGDVPGHYAEQRSQDTADVVDQITELGRRVVAVEADLGDTTVIPALFDRAEAELGPVDIVVNNASGWVCDTFRSATSDGIGRTLAPVTPESLETVFSVDTRAAALIIAEFARRLADRNGSWGRIVGLTSGGPAGFPDEVSYGAAKAAQENFTMSSATELAGLGVTANVVHPPVTDTGWVTDAVRSFVAESPEHTHVAGPTEVAEVITWLCSDAARMVSGNVIRLR